MKLPLQIFTALSVVSFLIVSCSETPSTKASNETSVEGDGWSKWGPTLPISMNNATDLVLSDYLLSGEKLERAIWHPSSEESITLDISVDSLNTTHISTPPANGIGYLQTAPGSSMLPEDFVNAEFVDQTNLRLSARRTIPTIRRNDCDTSHSSSNTCGEL